MVRNHPARLPHFNGSKEVPGSHSSITKKGTKLSKDQFGLFFREKMPARKRLACDQSGGLLPPSREHVPEMPHRAFRSPQWSTGA